MAPAFSSTDRYWMRQALRLAARGEGRTRPNPPVGAVLVRQESVVGRGWHRQAGGPHAEVEALREAGPAARGATLYVTLEPCCTQGRTPPCTEAILAAGIRRVVAGAADPNPRHAGRGLAQLSAAGIVTECGLLESDCLDLIAPFRRHVKTGRPYLTLKLAMTLDGRIADSAGCSRWITGPEARRWVHALRRRADAVMVGAGTACADDPSLLPVPSEPNRSLFRIVVDGMGRLPIEARLVNDAHAARTIVATTRRCPAERRAAWTRHGAQVWVLPGRQGRLNLRDLMLRIGAMGLLHVVCEGGGRLAAALVQEALVDAYAFFYAPWLLGGASVPGLAGSGWGLAIAPVLTIRSVRRLGNDLLVQAHPRLKGGAPCLPA